MDVNIWADLSSLRPAGSVCKLASVGVEAAGRVGEREWEDRDSHLKTGETERGPEQKENVLNFGQAKPAA